MTGIVNFRSVITVKRQFVSLWNILGHMDSGEHLEEIAQDFWLMMFSLKCNQQRSLPFLAFSLQGGCRDVSDGRPWRRGGGCLHLWFWQQMIGESLKVTKAMQAKPSHVHGADDLRGDTSKYSFLTYSSRLVSKGCWCLLYNSLKVHL